MFKIIATILKGENSVIEVNLKHNIRHKKWKKICLMKYCV